VIQSVFALLRILSSPVLVSAQSMYATGLLGALPPLNVVRSASRAFGMLVTSATLALPVGGMLLHV
jgi:hypothetical protein